MDASTRSTSICSVDQDASAALGFTSSPSACRCLYLPANPHQHMATGLAATVALARETPPHSSTSHCPASASPKLHAMLPLVSAHRNALDAKIQRPRRLSPTGCSVRYHTRTHTAPTRRQHALRLSGSTASATLSRSRPRPRTEVRRRPSSGPPGPSPSGHIDPTHPPSQTAADSPPPRRTRLSLATSPRHRQHDRETRISWRATLDLRTRIQGGGCPRCAADNAEGSSSMYTAPHQAYGFRFEYAQCGAHNDTLEGGLLWGSLDGDTAITIQTRRMLRYFVRDLRIDEFANPPSRLPLCPHSDAFPESASLRWRARGQDGRDAGCTSNAAPQSNCARHFPVEYGHWAFASLAVLTSFSRSQMPSVHIPQLIHAAAPTLGPGRPASGSFVSTDCTSPALRWWSRGQDDAAAVVHGQRDTKSNCARCPPVQASEPGTGTSRTTSTSRHTRHERGLFSPRFLARKCRPFCFVHIEIHRSLHHQTRRQAAIDISWVVTVDTGAASGCTSPTMSKPDHEHEHEHGEHDDSTSTSRTGILKLLWPLFCSADTG
ncbi:hypothetical protein C8R45DRAFT_1082026 [Mycena sanguinolenta]|nr:hypothetical protein C8R45DRAFT_1082026 [Mycena sanguinolenta]